MQSVGGGIRRDHTVSCPRTRQQDKSRGHRCECPFSWWEPQVAGQPRKRGRHYGTLSEAKAIKRRQEVDAGAARAEAAANGSRPVVREGDRTVFDYYARWLRHDEKRLAPGTITERARVYERHLHATFGAVRVADVSPQLIEDWIHAKQQAGVTYWPIRTAFNSFAAMLSTAANKRHIEWNPAGAVDLPPEPVRDRRDHMLTAEYRQTVEACDGDEEALWVRLAGEAGLRRGEIAGLRPERIDFDARELLVSANMVQVRGIGLVERPPKGGKNRFVALSQSRPLGSAAGLIASRLSFGWLPKDQSPFSDERVRQAVAHSWDRDAYLDAFYNTSKFEAEGLPITPGMAMSGPKPADVPTACSSGRP